MEQTKIQQWEESQEYQALGNLQKAFDVWLGYYAANDTSYFDHDINKAIESFEEAFQGEYDSELDFGYYLADELLPSYDNAPDFLVRYFDYESFTHDLFINDYWFEDGYVFMRI